MELNLKKPALELNRIPAENPIKQQNGKYVRRALVRAQSMAKKMV